MTKNKHNQVHTGNQSGKTPFPIASLLPVGRENAISTKDLVILRGCSSARELQQYIAYERNHGAIICSGSGNGYWRPKNRQEIVEFCRTMEARAKHTWAAARSAKQMLKTMKGQQEIPEVQDIE